MSLNDVSLTELDPSILQADGAGDPTAAVRALVPAAAETAASLAQLSQGFGAQGERLAQIAGLAAEITGIEIDSGVESQPDGGGGMLVDRFDPFGAGTQPEGGLVADPFASNGGSIFDTPAGDGGEEFAQTVLPGQEDTLFTRDDPFAGSTSGAVDLDGAGDPVPDAPLPSDAEKVYDLAEFDAQLLPSADVVESQPEAVHELSEFDAVRIE